MKKLLSLIILSMSLSSLAFATNKEYRSEEISRCKKDGHLKCDVEDNLVNGIVKYFNKDGSLSEEYSYKEGMLNGISKIYYNNGDLWIERNYKEGEKDGSEKRYSKGTISEEAVYKKGEKHGYERHYRSDGSLYFETPYVEGYENGVQKYYDAKGNILAENVFYEGKPVDGIVKVYTEKDVLKEEIPYKNGQESGIGKEYTSDGSLFSEIPFKNGKKEGTLKYYHKGKITREDNYKNDVRDGISKKYRPDGSWSETLYQNGKAVGEEKRFYPNDLVTFDGKLMKNEDAANALSYKMYHFTPIEIDSKEIVDLKVPAVWVDSETIEIRIGVNADKENLRFEIWDPKGNYSSPDELGRYMTYTNNPAMEGNNGSQFYQVKAPIKGPWGLGLINEDKTKSVNCKYYAIAESSISFDSKISKNRVVPNEKVDFLATLKRLDAPILDAKVEIVIQGWDRRRLETLFDDGRHNDGQANDGVYGNSLSFAEKGRYGVTFYVEGTAKMGDAFYRQSLEEFFFVE